MNKLLLLLPAIVLLASCGPSADPALQRRIDEYYAKANPRTFGVSMKDFKPMPYAVGQWAMYGVTGDGKRSISKESIVGQESGGWIIETYSLSETQESTMQMLVTGLDKARESMDPEDIDIVWVKTRDKNGKIETIEGPVLSVTKGLYRKNLVNFSVKQLGTEDGGSVTVPAGTFPGTIKTMAEATFFLSTYTSDGWFHSAVPINGMVKSVVREKNITMELLDFGKTGAVKSF